MGITDLLDRLPNSSIGGGPPLATGDGASSSLDEVPFSVEVPVVERVGVEIPPPTAPASVSGPAARTIEAERATTPPPPRRTGAAPLPSWAVAVIGGLSLLSLLLALALAAALTSPEPSADVSPPPASAPAEPAAPALAAPATFSAEPSPIPVDLITRLEEAGDQEFDVELSRLLDAVQHGFGRRSARLEPTLQAYVYRTSSRFLFDADRHRVAVTAPDAPLAAARAALLEQLFADAVAEGKLEVGHAVGPHALALVSE